jgi:hypothetical protein
VSDISCVPFSNFDGESIVIEQISKSSSSLTLSRDIIPLSTRDKPGRIDKWIKEDEIDLSLFKVSGTYWTISFDEYLGNVQSLQVTGHTMTSMSQLFVTDNFVA